MLQLPAELVAESGDFPVLVPRSYAARMLPGDPHDPLLRQVLPVADEQLPATGYTSDPVGDLAAEHRPGVLHKYHGRMLLVLTGGCAVNCRYCFRRHFPYATSTAGPRQWQASLEAISTDTSIEEVILSGGDPLVLDDALLAQFASEVEQIPHVRRLRIHTRLPIVIPERVNDQLRDWLASSRLATVVVLHANHANELDATVAAACRAACFHRRDAAEPGGAASQGERFGRRATRTLQAAGRSESRALLLAPARPGGRGGAFRSAGGRGIGNRARAACRATRLRCAAVRARNCRRAEQAGAGMTERISIYDTAAVDALRRELAMDPHLVQRMRTVLLKKFAGREAALDELPLAARRVFAERVEFHPLALDARFDSAEDGATKLVFVTASGKRIEAVLLRAGTGRTAVCLSSQVGCAANCDFCATGKMGFHSNLTAGELLDQVVQANEQIAGEGRKVRNIVLMGMGEPFHNEPAVYEALEVLLEGHSFNHPASRLLISTVGIPDAMLRCGRRFPRVNLALSLHSVRQEVREQIIPLARKYPLDELRQTIVELNAMQRGAVMVEYLMLAGVNDSLDDAAELAEFCRGLRVHVNLIPYNAIEGAPYLVGTSREVRDAFAIAIKATGLTTTIRYSMGADIEAACGQLVQRMERRRSGPVAVE